MARKPPPKKAAPRRGPTTAAKAPASATRARVAAGGAGKAAGGTARAAARTAKSASGETAPSRRRGSLTGKRLPKAAIDMLISAIPGEVVREVAALGAPLTRYSGASSISAALLARSLQVLAQPPAAPPVGDEMTLTDIAERVGRSRQAVVGWASAGLLGEAKKVGRTRRWGREALERARLVDYLLRHGVEPGELFEAAAKRQLALTVLRISLGSEATVTRTEAAKSAGLPDELLARFTRALGAPPGEPDEVVYSEKELDALRLLGALRSLYSDDDLVEVASVVGRAMHEIAEATLELFRRRFARPFADAGASGLELTLRLATVIDLTVPTTGPLLEMILRRQLEGAALAETITEVEQQAGRLDGQVEQAVGFADIVGFTTASAHLSALDVSRMAENLLHCAEEALVPHNARIVKSIGDAVMFTAPDLAIACAAAADLLEVAHGAGLPPLRVGIAYGPMLRAYADFFGRTVNVASRLCDIAGSGAIMVQKPDRPIRESEWKSLSLVAHDGGKKRLKGVDGRVPVLRVQRLG